MGREPMANSTDISRKVRGLGGQDEEARPDRHGGVRRSPLSRHSADHHGLTPRRALFSMSIGLGMTQEEWAALRAQVDDSFWVMRVIGPSPIMAFGSPNPSAARSDPVLI